MEPPTQQELAEERTALARERTELARHRTFAAWVRTGLASIAVGLGAAELLRDFGPDPVVPAAAATLIACGAAILILAFNGYRDTLSSSHPRQGGVPRWGLLILTGALLASAIALLAVVITS